MLRRLLPQQNYLALARLYKRFRHFGFQAYCPICRARLRAFLPYAEATGVRKHAVCSVCESQERHRALYLYLKERTDLFSLSLSSFKLLHLAPEQCLEGPLQRLARVDYLSADLDSPRAMVKIDLQRLAFPENCFNGIICSHVLEHIPDDSRAMREMFRVLAPGGWALVMTPMNRGPGGEKTHEQPAGATPNDRLRIFGQADHLRLYGHDLADRLAAVGFQVRAESPARFLGPGASVKYGLLEEEFFYCLKTWKSEAGIGNKISIG